MLQNTRSVGKKYEQLAGNYLKKLGYKILAANYQIRGGEIDIVARDGEYLVFVEVKARYSDTFGQSIESITPWKIQALLKTARFYIQKINWGDRPYRFDLVAIDVIDKKQEIKLIKNIIS